MSFNYRDIQKLAYVLLDEDYKTTIRTHSWISNLGQFMYTVVAERVHTTTCEEKLYEQDRAIHSTEHITKDALKELMLKDLIDDILREEIKETNIDEN